MKKITKIVPILLLAVLFIVGVLAACAKKEEVPETIGNDPEIMGTWLEDYWNSGYAFCEDGTGEDVFWSQPFTFVAVDGSLKIKYVEGLWADKEFSYTINGDILTLTEVVKAPMDGSATPEAGTWDYKKVR